MSLARAPWLPSSFGMRAVLIRAQDLIQASLILLSGLVMFGLVLTRYLLGYSDASVEMIARYIAILGAFIGLATAHRNGFTIRFSLLDYVLPPAARRAISILTALSSMGVCAVLVWAGWQYVLETRMLGETMQTGIAMPLWIPRLAVVVGALLLTLEYGLDALRLLLGAAPTQADVSV